MTTYVLVHGAWHTGSLLEDTAKHLRAMGHEVHCPTLVGNREGDAKNTGLEEAISGLVADIEALGQTGIVLLGHSYGGMVISGAYPRLAPGVVKRLVYWSAFVPEDGESLEDLIPPHIAKLFASLVQEDGGFDMPYPVWRDAFMNDADGATAQSVYDLLNRHPHKSFLDKARLPSPPATWEVGKSYIHCQSDMALPGSLPWWPRLAERLGLYRYVWHAGGHEICFTDPEGLAKAIHKAGED